MGSDKAEKKRLKAEAKLLKKRAKMDLSSVALAKEEVPQPIPNAPTTEQPSPAVRFAEGVRGILYITGSISLVLAAVLQERGVWLSLSDIVDDLLVIRAGQILLIIIALALFIYGLKHIRLVK